MYLFVAIILIAELIIAMAIILGILKLDKTVKELSRKIEDLQPKVKETISKVRVGAELALKKAKEFAEFIKIQQERYVINVLKNILVFFLLILSKGKSKKFLSGIELAISVGDFLACK